MAPAWVSGVVLVALLTAPAANGNPCTVRIISTDDQLSQVQCPEFNIHLALKTTSDERPQLVVSCTERPDFALLENLPGLPAYQFEELAYRGCPLPVGNQSLVQQLSPLLERNQLSAIRRLFFVDNAKLSAPVPLAPDLFLGLTDLKVLSMKYSTRMPLDNPLLFAHLPPSLTWIDLRLGDGGSGAANGLLQPLTHLETLELTENGLVTLPSERISALPNLRTITLYGNKLVHIEPFADLPELTDLDLKYNRLETLQEDVFAGLPSLSKLVLKSNRLASLPSGLLRNNTKLVTFDADYQLGAGLTLGDGLFAGLKMLQRVTLSRCKLAQLPAGLFANATALSVINLNDNKLQSLPPTLLRGLANLKELHLQRNELLDALPDMLLHDASQLRFLYLGHNNLTKLSKDDLKSQRALEELHLEYNQLYMIDTKAFEAQKYSLQMLNLSHNQLALHHNGVDISYRDGAAYYISETPFHPLSSVTVLDLSHNAIVKIFLDFTKFMGNLQSLDLSHNLITDVHTANFPFLSPKLTQLNLESNRIANPVFIRSLRKDARLPAAILLAGNPLNCDCLSYPLIAYLQAQSDAGQSVPLKGLQCAQPASLSGRKPLEVQLEKLVCEIDSASCGPAGCTCFKRAVDRAAVVDCSVLNLTQVPAIPHPSLIDADFIELHLEHNLLHDLANTGDGWNTIRQLYVANNSLTTLSEGQLPPQLEVLDISGNRFTELDTAFLTKRNQSALRNLVLSANPWSCDCDNALLAFAVDNAALISDYSSLRCGDGRPINSTTLNDLCAWTVLFIVCVVVAVAAFICLCCLLFYMRYSLEIKVWLFKHNWLQWMVAEEQLDTDKRYDAFVSYSHMDEEFITKELLPRLECETLDFKICWHVRDFMPGEMIASQITNAVEESRRTIIVLSPHYLESVWGQMEFNTAYLQSLKDKRNRVIPIIYEDIGDIDQLDPELRAYLKTNTYVRRDDPWFWDKLLYAMPHKRRLKGVQAKSNMRLASMDKLNLLKAPPAPPSIESTPPIERSLAEKGIGHDGPLGSYPDPSKPTTISIISDGVVCI